jgi:hypothetical protein
MTEHRTITGLVAVVLLAAATTAAIVRPSAHRAVVATNSMLIGELTAAAGQLPTSEFDDQSVIFSTKR